MAEERYNIYRSTVHWRYAMARPHLMFFDARLIFFIALFGFHIRWWTFMLLVLAVAGFTGASYLNYTLENVVRLLRSKLVGPFRPAVPYTRLRLMVEYGAEYYQTFSDQKGPEASYTGSPSGGSVRPLWSGDLQLDCTHKPNRKPDLEYIQDGDRR
jgi:hypothetical protein